MNKTHLLWLLGGLIVLLCGLVAITTWLAPSDDTALSESIPAEETTPMSQYETMVIGQSVEGRDITVHRFGTGEKEVLFVGGIHGGYEWNSSLLAWNMIDFFITNESLVPEELTVSIIPTLNPDGLALVTGSNGRFSATDVAAPESRNAEARFNANDVDLNRNFACKWQPTSTWRGETVSAGTAAFSEPEAEALRQYVTAQLPAAVVFWHSQANNVYASECLDGPLATTLDLMNDYATAGNYGAVASFDAYPITGDAEGWLASIGIPAITVELESFRSIEWERNKAGTLSVLEYFTTTTE